MNFREMVKLGLMKRLSTGEYVLTIKGQRLYLNDPNWKPKQPGKATMTKEQLDKYLGTTLTWENDPLRETD